MRVRRWGTVVRPRGVRDRVHVAGRSGFRYALDRFDGSLVLARRVAGHPARPSTALAAAVRCPATAAPWSPTGWSTCTPRYYPFYPSPSGKGFVLLAFGL